MSSAVQQALRSSAVVVVEERGVLAVTGPDRVTWLNGVVTCDVAKVTPERAQFGLLLNKQGKIQTDFYCIAGSGGLVLATAPGTSQATLSALDPMLVMEDAELSDRSEAAQLISLHGPRSLELARSAGGSASELDRTGLGGAVFVCERERVSSVLVELEAMGATTARPGDWPAIRVELGIGEFGVDYGPADNPHEAALDRLAVAWNKGCYLGQETVFMQDARGRVKRRLARIGLLGSALPPSGEAVLGAGGRKVGEVTTSALGALSGKPGALARLAAPDFEPGTRLIVAGEAARVEPNPPAP